MTDDTQPEAMDLADWLEAVGAGGVSGPLVGRTATPTHRNRQGDGGS